MFLRKIRQKVYTLRLDCIVKIDSSLSKKPVKWRIYVLECIVKFDSSLSLPFLEWCLYSLDCIVKFDSSLAGVDFKNE